MFSGALGLLVRKAHLLIENENNNRAERLMNIVARFNMGKRLNLIQRGSYERRAHLAGLRHNKRSFWHSSPWKRATGQSPGQHLKKFMKRAASKKSAVKSKRKLFPDQQEQSGKKKRKVEKNTDYGPMAEQPDEDENFIDEEIIRIKESLTVCILVHNSI